MSKGALSKDHPDQQSQSLALTGFTLLPFPLMVLLPEFPRLVPLPHGVCADDCCCDAKDDGEDDLGEVRCLGGRHDGAGSEEWVA